MHRRGPGRTSDKYGDVRACFVFVDQELLERFHTLSSWNLFGSMLCRLCVRNLQHPAFKYSCLICCLLPLGNRMGGPEHRQWVLSHAADLAFVAGRSTG